MRINYMLRLRSPAVAVRGVLVVRTPMSNEAVKDQFRCAAAVCRGTDETPALERAA